MKSRPIFALVSMFANEEHIAPHFVQQANKFFDFCLFARHRSADSTSTILSEAGYGIEIDLKSNGYPQAETMSELMKLAFDRGADLVAPLDFDEFLPFGSRADLEEYIATVNSSDAIYCHWQNLFSAEFHLPLDQRTFWSAHERAEIRKIIVLRSAWEKDRDLALVQGNHAISSSANLSSVTAPWTLLHVPINSQWQFAQKVFRGNAVAKRQQKVDRDFSGAHWMRASMNPFPAIKDLERLAFDYGEIECQLHSELNQVLGSSFLDAVERPILQSEIGTLATFTENWESYFRERQPLEGVESPSVQSFELALLEVAEMRRQIILKGLGLFGLLRIARRLHQVARKLRGFSSASQSKKGSAPTTPGITSRLPGLRVLHSGKKGSGSTDGNPISKRT